MPRVPRRSQATLGTAPLPGVRTPTGVPQGVFGSPGPDIRPVLGPIADMIARERDNADQVAILDADNRLAKLQTDLSLKAQQRRGKDALGATSEIQGEWETSASSVEAGLSNDRQKAAFRRARDQRGQSLYGIVERHASQEFAKYDEETTNTAIASRVNDALTNYQDINAVAKAGVELRAIVRDQGHRQGQDETVIEARVTENLSKLHTGVIGRYLAAGDDRAAAAYYAKVPKGQILGEHADNIDKALEVASTLGEGQRNADRIMALPEVNRTTAYAEAAKLTEPKVRRAAEQELDAAFARRERAEKERDDELTARAAEAVERGERPSAAIWSQLRPAVRTALDARRKSVLRGDTVETEPTAWYELRRMAVEDPQKFAKLNLLEYRAKLSNQDFEQMGNLQATAIKKGGEAVRGILSDDEIVNQTLAPLFPKADKDKATGAERAAALREIDSLIVNEKRATGKDQLPSERVQAITDAYLVRREFSKGGSPHGLKRDGLGTPVIATEDIPSADRNRLVAYLRGQRLSVSTSKVERLAAAVKLGLPQATFDAIAREP